MDYLDCAKWVTEVGGLEDVSERDMMGRTILFAACENGYLNCTKWLIDTGGVSDHIRIRLTTWRRHQWRLHAKEGNSQF